ncbi:MAG: asparaginase [Candidatus Thorarchaeota archaeon]|jgi:glutamyl-tRNA(Gln) amidotransferase subunit D
MVKLVLSFDGFEGPKMTEKAKVCIIATGGTIASVTNESTHSLHPGLKVDQLLSSLPGMSDIEIVHRDLFQMDSANFQPHHWQEIATAIKEVNEEIPNLTGIVVTHGTDTMVYSASAISFMVQDFGKPIVFTGSQISATVPWSDGPRNLLDAIRVAAFADLGETCIVFTGEIHRPTRTKKTRSNTYDAFDSMDPRPLGVMAREIVLYEGRRKRHNLVPRYDTRLDDRVFLLKVFPGIPPKILNRIMDLGYHGIVIEGYGEGSIPSEENALAGGISQAISLGSFVVVSSQCTFGQADLSVYDVGRAALEVGAMGAHDMTSEAAFVKLAWVLGHTRERDDVREMMMTNYVGEVIYTIDDD